VEIASQGILRPQKLRCYNGIVQKISRSLSQLTDAQLIGEVNALAACEREATAHLIASLAELDARRLYLGEGYSSLFTYCTQSLHLSEHAAYNRIEAATHNKLRRAQDLLRHSVPNGDPAEIFDRALTVLVEQLERAKLAWTTRPRAPRVQVTDSRHIPASVKRAVWARDGGCCAFDGKEGRCAERGFLEFHHVVPYASGGLATVDNIQMRCRAHNQHEADEWFGPLGAREQCHNQQPTGRIAPANQRCDHWPPADSESSTERSVE
jgi:5-methylcytosine-specific restriction endonuclease McrA